MSQFLGMASIARSTGSGSRALAANIRRLTQLSARSTSRNFTTSASRRTDGVFRELTAVRIQTPWVEALRKKKADGEDPTQASGKPEVPANRDLTPKRMSDSYHSVVWSSPLW